MDGGGEGETSKRERVFARRLTETVNLKQGKNDGGNKGAGNNWKLRTLGMERMLAVSSRREEYGQFTSLAYGAGIPGSGSHENNRKAKRLGVELKSVLLSLVSCRQPQNKQF